MTAELRVVSLGAGVQSTALLLLALAGDVAADVAVFADTGWEPAAVYRHLALLEQAAAAAAFPLYRVSAGNVRDAALGADGRRPLHLPTYTRGPRGDGMSQRQCTRDHKVRPIRRLVRQMMRERGARRAVSLLGISLDEAERVRDGQPPIANAYPLIERGWTRGRCAEYLAGLGWSAPRSACIGCPYHTDSEWRALRASDPAAWDDAVAFDSAVRAVHRPFGIDAYLHRQRVPLAAVDLTTREERGQLTFADECEGLCGV